MLSEATFILRGRCGQGRVLGSRERVPFCLGGAVLIVYALLFGVFALCVMSFTGAIFESQRRRL